MAPFFSRRASKQDKPRENAGTNEKPLPAPPRATSFNFRSGKKEKEKNSLDEKAAQHGRGSSAQSLAPPSNGIGHDVHIAENGLSNLRIGSNNDNNNNNDNGGPSSSATSIRPSSSAFRPRSVSPNKSDRGPSTSDLSQRSSMVAGYGGLSAVDEGGEGHGHYVPVQASWSSMAEDDLINNLGPRERGRQEVLWEIVSSEERYVQDLVKLVDTFASALLPAFSTTPTLTLDDPIASLMRTLSPRSSFSASPAPGSPVNSQASPALPIAAQFARSRQGSLFDDPSSPVAHAGPVADARMDAYQKLTNGRPGVGGSTTSVNQAGLAGSGNGNGSGIGNSNGSGNAGLGVGMGSVRPGMTSRASLPGPARRQNSFTGSVRNASAPSMLGQAELPEELKTVLQTIAQGILPGHVKLAAALRKRYENQYPLVRSLADVFTAHSSILREYATYVLHLERALEAIDTALLAYQSTSKRLSYTRDRDKALVELGKTLWHVDQIAASKAETGLAISLSKPFQRLLKYPLLFQNLLFNTDPSLKEYEATLAMVDEVEAIVRGIEDEKTSQEERNKARDGWARIDGIDVKELMVPKPNRMLISESRAMSDMPEVQALSKSRHRLSDILKKQDPAEYWTVKFSDVTLLCEKTGITHLPLSGTNQLASMDGKARKRASMQRSQSVRARNLYKFCKVVEWAELPRHERSASGAAASPHTQSSAASATASRASLARITQSPPATPQKRPTATASPLSGPDTTPKHTPIRVPLKTNDGPSNTPASSTSKRPVDADASTVVSDRQSVMSFAFKGGDQLKPARVRARPASGVLPRSTREASADAAGASGSRREQKDGDAKAMPPPNRPTSYSTRTPGGHVQTKAATAKFAHRLRPIEGLDTALPGEHHGETADARGQGQGQGQQQSERAKRMVSVRSSLPPAMRRAEVAQRQAVTQTAAKSAPGEDERRARMSTPPVVGVSSRLLAPTAASAARSVTSSRRGAPKGRGGMI